MKPQRIQLSRCKGYRKPEGAVVVSRPSKWGNPFTVNEYPTLLQEDGRWRAAAVHDYESALRQRLIPRVTIDDVRRELRGKDLACWCPLGQACHADVLLELANE